MGQGDRPPMAELVWSGTIGWIARVRADERRPALGAFATLFGFMTGHALLETARDALFLASLPAVQLPWAYLAIAVIALPLTVSQPRFLRRLSSRSELSGWLILSCVVTFGFWLALGWAGPWVYYALYTWSGVLATLVVVRFWTALSNLFTVTQAKRVFALVGSGSVLGAVVGYGAARVLAEWLPARHLVAAAAVAFALTSLGPRLLGSAEQQGFLPAAGLRSELSQIVHVIWSRAYLRRIGALILLSTVTLTLVDFVFKLTVDRTVPAAAMGEFFSGVYLVLNVLSLAVQVLLVAWLLRRVGVTLAMALVPLFLLLGSVGFVVVGGLTMALLLKGADGALRHSLHRTGTELLFVPMAVEYRGRVKAVIDVLGQRGGQAAASLLILATLAVTPKGVVFAAVASVGAALWLMLALDLRRHYLDVFRETLSQEISEARIAFPALDLASLESLLATLNDSDDRKVIAALELLATQGRAHVIPALLLYHPSAAVVVRALEIFLQSGRTDFLAIVERLMAHADCEVRAAALVVKSVLRPEAERLRQALEDPAGEVRATALVGLIAGSWMSGLEADAALEAVLAGDSAEARVALAKAIQHQPAAGFEATLVRLARSDDGAVRHEALRAMRAMPSTIFMDTLIAALGERSLRDEARLALLAVGPPALPRLAAALRDAAGSHAVRRHLPGTIAAFGTAQSAELLLQHLPRESDGMIRFKVLGALGRLLDEQPHLRLDPAPLAQAAQQTLSVALGFMRWRRALERGARERDGRRTEVHAVLVALLRDKQRHAVERLFRLLGLQGRDGDYLRIHRGLVSRRRESQAGSRELLENLLPQSLATPLLALVDDLYDLPVEPPLEPERPASYAAVVAELLESSAETLSGLAARHAAELGLAEIAGRLATVPALSPEHREVLASARAQFLAPPSGGASHA